MDLFVSITSLILSTIAIIVSIYTVQHQNKLHLFDKRYETLAMLSFLMSVAKLSIENCNQFEKDILNIGRESYYDINYLGKQTTQDCSLNDFYLNICLSTIKLQFLFPKRHIKLCKKFLHKFMDYCSATLNDQDSTIHKKELSDLINEMEQTKTLEKLDSYMKIG